MNITPQQHVRLIAPYIDIVKFQYAGWGQGFPFKGITSFIDGSIYLHTYCDENKNGFHISNSKLLLKPLTEISDEDAIEAANTEFGRFRKPNEEYLKYNSSKFRRAIFEHNQMRFVINNTVVFLQSKGCDVPVFIEPNHPDNGKTLIELGLAIDKTTI